MFLETHKFIGTIKVGESREIEFPYDETVSYIKKITISCDCTRAYNIAKDRKIVAVFTAKPIPKHLESQGWYEKTLSITVVYVVKQVVNDGTEQTSSETAQFKVKIIR